MFKWLKRHQAATNRPITFTAADVPKIMQQYGSLLEKYPAAYMDETWLPLPKDQMRLAFKAAWKMAPNAELRNWVEVGWTFLSMFQPGVGQTPVGSAISEEVSPQSIAQLRRFAELSKLAQTEGEIDLAEMKVFIRNN